MTVVNYKDKYYIITVTKIYDIDGKEVAALLGIGHSTYLKDLEEIRFVVINIVIILSLLSAALLFSTLYFTNRTLIEKAKVEKLIENSQMAGVFLDRNGKITYSNKRFQSLLGYKEDEIIKHDFHDLIHGHAVAKEECPIFNAVVNGQELTANEKVYSSTGEEFEVEITVLPVLEQDKNFGSIVLIRKL